MRGPLDDHRGNGVAALRLFEDDDRECGDVSSRQAGAHQGAKSIPAQTVGERFLQRSLWHSPIPGSGHRRQPVASETETTSNIINEGSVPSRSHRGPFPVASIASRSRADQKNQSGTARQCPLVRNAQIMVDKNTARGRK